MVVTASVARFGLHEPCCLSGVLVGHPMRPESLGL